MAGAAPGADTVRKSAPAPRNWGAADNLGSLPRVMVAPPHPVLKDGRRGMRWPSFRRRRYPVWADLIQPVPDPVSNALAEIAQDAQAEAVRLARLEAVLNEPTVVINRQLRIPGYLARGWEDE